MPVSRNSSRRRSPHDVLHQPLPMDDLVINTRSPFDRPKRWKKFFKYALALILVVAAVSVSLHALRPDSKETDVATASNVAASINGSIDKGTHHSHCQWNEKLINSFHQVMMIRSGRCLKNSSHSQHRSHSRLSQSLHLFPSSTSTAQSFLHF